jgi:hypothetical protein
MTTFTTFDGTTHTLGARSHAHVHTGFQDNSMLTAQVTLRDGTQKLLSLPADGLLADELALRGLKAVLVSRLSGLTESADILAVFDHFAQQIAEGHLGDNASPKGSSGLSELGQALVHITGKTPAEVRAILAGFTMKQKHALRRTEKVVAFLQSRPKEPEQWDLLASLGL